jgi:gamma-glutamyltranspeptidase/glutathione hydrolase
VYLSKHYGKLSLAESLQPAIRYAEQGFNIGKRHQKLLGFRKTILNKDAETAALLDLVVLRYSLLYLKQQKSALN